MVKSIVAILLILAGIVGGLYVGLWWAFIGGIIDVVTAIKADDVDAIGLAIGVVKMIFATLIGLVSAVVFTIPGWVMLKKS